jgi:hypothetical protein
VACLDPLRIQRVHDVHVTPEEEARRLDAQLAGREPFALHPAATRGRRAELYLEPPSVRSEALLAIALAEEGLGLVKAGDPIYAKLLHVLARALRAARSQTGGEIDGRAAKADRDAWLLAVDPAPALALLYAEQWGDWAWDQEVWSEAAEAYDGAGTALDRLLHRETGEYVQRLGLLSRHRLSAPRSAFAYLRVKDVLHAVDVLERAAYNLSGGRTQRRDVLRLRSLGHPDLADSLLAATAALAEAATLSRDQYGHASAAQQRAQAHVNELILEIRRLPGMATFATPSGFPDTFAAAAQQPICYLAPTDRGTSMIVAKARGEMCFAQLWPTEEDIRTAASDFLSLEFGEFRGDSGAALFELLDWLGLHVMRYVRDAIGERAITLVPFGLLAALPLHAALIKSAPDAGRSTRFVLALNPGTATFGDSARSWVDAAGRVCRPRLPDALVVNNPSPLPVAFDELVLSDFERDVVANHFMVSELPGPFATRSNILNALPAAWVAHLSCHGTVNKDLYSTGLLVLASPESLSTDDFAESPELAARLIFLSACRSGATAVGVPQATGIPTALLAAGAAAVIGTFWHTDEMATLLIVSRFYELWRGGSGTSIRDALGRAQEWLMTASAGELTSAVPAAALATDAAVRLRHTPASDCPFVQPWYWAPFFVLGS